MNKINPFPEGTSDWVSFEWSNLAQQLVKIKTVDPFKDLPPDEWDTAQRELEEIENKIEKFKSRYFPNHPPSRPK